MVNPISPPQQQMSSIPSTSTPSKAQENTPFENFRKTLSEEQLSKLENGTAACFFGPDGNTFGIWNDGIGVLGDSILMKDITSPSEESSDEPAKWGGDLARFEVFLDMLQIMPDVKTSQLKTDDLKDKICEYIGVEQGNPPTQEQLQSLLEIWHAAEYLNCDKLKEACHVCIEAWVETKDSNGRRWLDNKNAITNFFKKCGHQTFVNYAFLRRQDRGVTLLMEYYLPYFAQLLNQERPLLSGGEDPDNNSLSDGQVDHICHALQGVTHFSLDYCFYHGGLEGVPNSKVFTDIVRHCTCLEELDMSQIIPKDAMDYVEWLCDAENSSYLNLDFVKKINLRMPDLSMDPYYYLPRENPKLPNFKKFKSLLEKCPALLEIDLTHCSFKPATSEELLKDHPAFAKAINRDANESTLQIQMVVRGAQLLRDHPTLEVIYLTYPMTSGSTGEVFMELQKCSSFEDFAFLKGIKGGGHRLMGVKGEHDRLIRRRAATL